MLKSGEKIEDLQFKGLKIIQHESAFRFGTDSVLLANFAKAHSGDKVIDLGAGTGIIAILLAGKTKATEIIGIEIQESIAEMAQRSVELNELGERVKIKNGDFRNVGSLGKSTFNVVVSNPPYRKIGSGMVSESSEHAIARHEVCCTLTELIVSASALLVNKGHFYMIHQAERLADIICGLRDNNLEPKRICLIHPSIDKSPNLVLIDAIKGAKSHIDWLPPIFVSNVDIHTKSLFKEVIENE